MTYQKRLLNCPLVSKNDRLYLVWIHSFSSIEEATVHDIQLAFKQNQLITSRNSLSFTLKQISRLNPVS
ncbi:hypothetical protein CFP56_033215 [Quercus suber]|uniref:Uncharacterized protein n=1 Tax=Quercus suber TaxID=58331 RepID=A0AAW0MC13_QUESU